MASQNIDPLAPTTSVASRKKTSEQGKTDAGCQSVKKRLQQELMNLMVSGDKGVSAFPSDDNIFTWVGTINGGHDTVYEGLIYKLKLDFPSNYPYTAPSVRFVTPCFHPNVDDHGNICLDILKEKWTALYDVRTILLSVQSLLAEPNIHSPLNIQAAELWKDQVKYKTYLHEKYDAEVRKKQNL